MDFTQASFQKQLDQTIMPFWLQQEDKTFGGFYGQVAEDLTVDKEADKSAILMTRYLWALSATYAQSPKPEVLEAAHNVYQFIVNEMQDEQNKGLFWSVTYDGQPAITQKHVYVQSFAIYALSEYYKVTQDVSSLNLAIDLFNLIEEKAYRLDDNGYHEEFNINWQPSVATLMGPKGHLTYYTTNTVLHLIEAYTNLYQVHPTATLLERLKNLLMIFSEHIVSDKGHCQTEFTRDWQALTSDISYAHDIETAWLLYRTLEIIGDTTDFSFTLLIERLVESVITEGLDSNEIIIDHSQNGRKSTVKQWWSLAESVVGFYDAYQRTGNEDYKQLAKKHWDFVQAHLLLPDALSEWLPHVDEAGQAVSDKSSNLSDGWKGPYHTARMYVEMLGRLSQK